jgi:hypothetical protein
LFTITSPGAASAGSRREIRCRRARDQPATRTIGSAPTAVTVAFVNQISLSVAPKFVP